MKYRVEFERPVWERIVQLVEADGIEEAIEKAFANEGTEIDADIGDGIDFVEWNVLDVEVG